MKVEINGWILLVVAIIFVGVIGGYFINSELEKLKEEIRLQGQQEGVINVIQQINTDPFKIPILMPEGNGTKLDWIPIAEICGGQND